MLTFKHQLSKIFLIQLILVLASCASTSNLDTSNDSLLIEMIRTRCLGNCPDYEVKIYENGNFEFRGAAHVPFIGEYSGKMDVKELKFLKDQLGNIDFFALKERYYQDISDLPTTYITYHKNGKTKKIMDYYGAPPELKALEESIQKFVFKSLPQ